MSEENVEVKIPKAIADHLEKQDWFRAYYRDLEDFALDAVRRLKESWERTKQG